MASVIEIRKELSKQLIENNRLWSFDANKITELSDAELIEKSLIYLDIEQINQLFTLFPYNKIKQIWKEKLVPRDDYYHSLNRFFAWYYFNSKQPDKYLKSLQTRYLNRLLLCKD